ncbi:hypothetical protein HYDPIDRAFT_26861 [Hydnomerulius pinastri MD-312]|nr:hypothetical protein HYDPIDRAFT_26861 [Hydnomerulius pinastri MD-312]
MSGVTPITSFADFRKIINSDKVVFIDFWAEWCGPCRAIKPIFETLANAHGEVAEFYSVNIEENEDASQEVAVTSVPTFIAFKNGDILGQVVGAVPPSLQALITKHAPTV